MRRFLITFKALFATAPASDRACRFVGAKFAKTSSACTDMECSFIVRSEETGQISPEFFSLSLGPTRRVTCTEAEQLMTEMLAGLEGDPYRVAGSIFANVIQGGLEPLVLARVPLSHHALHTMNQIAKLDSESLERIDGSLLKDFNRLMISLIEQASLDAHHHDTHSGTLGGMFHFWFDLAALLPAELLPLPSANELIPVTLQTIITSPVHRSSFQGECRLGLKMGEDAIDYSLAIVGAIDRVSTAARIGQPQISRIEIDAIDNILASKYAGKSASVAMLLYWAKRQLCPFITRIAQLVFDYGDEEKKAATVKFMVSLIRECVDHSNVHARIRASIILGHFKKGIPLTAVLSVDAYKGEVVDQVSNPTLPWIAALAEDNIEASLEIRNSLFFITHEHLRPMLAHGAEETRSMFVPEAEYDGDGDYQEYTRGLGRSIGLCIRYGNGLQMLRLDPVIVKLLKNPARALEIAGCGLTEPPFEIPGMITLSEIMESIHLVRQGIRDTLGPAAFDCLSDSEFIASFV
jgi:hypothetical protein